MFQLFLPAAVVQLLLQTDIVVWLFGNFAEKLENKTLLLYNHIKVYTEIVHAYLVWGAIFIQ